MVDGVIYGWLNRDRETWQIRPGARGGAALFLLDGLLLPEALDDAVMPEEGFSYPMLAQPGEAGAQSIKVLILYTADVRIRVGLANMPSFLQSWEDWMNQALVNGGNGDISIDFVYSEETSYSPSGSLSTDLDRLQGTSDGFMDAVHSLRQTWAADLVHLVRADYASNVCGIAFRGDGSVSPSAGFGVSAESCGAVTFTHELGHNFGMHHDAYVVTGSTTWPWGYGYVDPNFSFRTIMSYHNQCVANTGADCPRIQFFSDPDVMYNGRPIGLQPVSGSRSADNARVIQETASVVATYSDWLSVGACSFGSYTPTIDRVVYLGSNGSILVPLVNTGTGSCQAESFRFTATPRFSGEWPTYVLGTQTSGSVAAGGNLNVATTYAPTGLDMVAGQYDLRLELRGGSYFALGTIEIRGNPSNSAPTAQITALPTSGTIPLTVTFSAAGSSDPNGDALTYSWTFGDGYSGTGVSASHTYTTAGTYTARVTVSDGNLTATASTTITVTAPSDGNDHPWEAIAVSSLPYSISSTLDPEASDEDWYRVNASVGQYTFSVDSALDTKLWVYGPGDSDGDPRPALVTSDDDGGTGFNPLIIVPLSTAGYHFLRVAKYNNDPPAGKGGDSTPSQANEFGLSANPNTAGDAGPLVDEKAAKVAAAADVASPAVAAYTLTITRQDVACDVTGAGFRYVSTAAASSVVSFEMDFRNQGSGTCTNETVRFHLYRTLGDQLTAILVGSAAETISIAPGATATFTLSFVPSQLGISPGTYYPASELVSTGVWWGYYNTPQPLTITAPSDGNDHPWEAIAVSSLPYSISSTLDPEASDEDWYRVNASVGQYTFSVDSALDTKLWVYGPGDSDGDPRPALVTSDDDGGTGFNPLIIVPLSTAGYHFLRVAKYNNDPPAGKGGDSTPSQAYEFGLSANPNTAGDAEPTVDETAAKVEAVADAASPAAAAAYTLTITRQDLACELSGSGTNTLRYPATASASSTVQFEEDFSNVGSGTCTNETVRFHLYRTVGDRSTAILVGTASETHSIASGATATFTLSFVPSQRGIPPGTYYPTAEIVSTGVWWAYYTTPRPFTVQPASSNYAPSAQISATPTSGVAPLAVTFSAAGSSDPDGNALTYAWAFGDGATGTGVSAAHTYASAGTYTATVTVSDGSLTATASTTITVTAANRAPTAVVTATPTSGVAPLAVSFSAAGSSDPDGNALTYSWNFGDGTTGSGLSTTHTYTAAGSYTASVTVSDGSLSAQATAAIQVSAPNRAPVAAITASATSGTAPLAVVLNGSGSSDPDGNPLVFTWDFGDGQAGTGAVVGHVYPAAGTYVVGLTVSDGSLTSTATVTITVRAPNRAPVAAITASATSGTAPLAVVLDGSGSSDPDGNPLVFTWDFGNGQTGAGVVVGHVYQAAGTYVVGLTVSDGSLTATATKSILVASGVPIEIQSLPASFMLGPAYPNPFNPQTMIPFAVPIDSPVRIVVSDLLGRSVKVLVNDRSLVPGYHQTTFQAGDLPSGRYRVTMTAGSYHSSINILLVK